MVEEAAAVHLLRQDDATQPALRISRPLDFAPVDGPLAESHGAPPDVAAGSIHTFPPGFSADRSIHELSISSGVAPAVRSDRLGLSVDGLKLVDAVDHGRFMVDSSNFADMINQVRTEIDLSGLGDLLSLASRLAMGLHGRSAMDQGGTDAEHDPRRSSELAFSLESDGEADAPQSNMGSTPNASAITRLAMTGSLAVDATTPSDAALLLNAAPITNTVKGSTGDQPALALEPFADLDSGRSSAPGVANESRAISHSNGLSRYGFDADQARFLATTALSFANGAYASFVEVAGWQVGDRACLLAHMAIDTAALERAIGCVVDEVERFGGELVSWLGDENVQPWIEGSVAIVAIGLSGALAVRRRAQRPTAEEIEAESSTWIFTQLQHVNG